MLTNFLPFQLSIIIQETFSSIPSPPVVFKLLPAAGEMLPEMLQQAPYAFLHNSELEQLFSYRLAKRRSEYLTGRVCAKVAASNYLQTVTTQKLPAMRQIEIHNSENGCPFITIDSAGAYPVPDISISHSRGYGAAVAAKYHCGIDIQRQSKSLIKVKEKYCRKSEYHLLSKIAAKTDELSQLSLLWSAKEAIQKTFGTKTKMPTFLDIQMQSGEKKGADSMLLLFSLSPGKSQGSPEAITVAAGIFREYAIAVSVLKESD